VEQISWRKKEEGVGGEVSLYTTSLASLITTPTPTPTKQVVALHVLGAWLFMSSGGDSSLSSLQGLMGILTLGIVSGRCGWLMHEAGHYSLTGKINPDRALQVGVVCGRGSVCGYVLMGGSVCEWVGGHVCVVYTKCVGE
jgi:hypothetical protein